MEPLSAYEEEKWEEHKRFLDMQKNRVKIYESPDGGETVFERYFGEEPSKRRQIKPEPKKEAFVQYGKDEHEVFITKDAFDQIIVTQNEEPMEVITANLVDFDDDDDSFEFEFENDDENEFVHDEPSEEEEEKWWVEKGMVDHPPHYNKGIETSEYIRSWEMNWDQANVIKYITRYNLKHSQPDLQCQDLRKARHYLDRLIESYEEKQD